MSINFHLIASHLVQFKELQMSNSSCPIDIAIAIGNKKNLLPVQRKFLSRQRNVKEKKFKKINI
jgi:hypothetical protein